MSQRTDRVDELLRQEIGVIIAREAADPRIGFATIKVAPRSSTARRSRDATTGWFCAVSLPTTSSEPVTA